VRLSRAPRWTWVHLRASLARLVAMVLVAACAEFIVAPQTPERAVRAIQLSAMDLSLDDGQSSQLIATVLDQHGVAFEQLPLGVSVQWLSSVANVATVDSTGVVSALHPGSAQITASVTGRFGTASVDAGIAVLPVPSGMAAAAGDAQQGAVGLALPAKFGVRVIDRHGDGVAGVDVDFVVAVGGGSLDVPRVATDATGDAVVHLTLGTQSGENRVEARTTRLPGTLVSLSAVGVSGAANTLAKLSGDGQSALAASALAAPLVARVTDRFGNGVPGVTVDWSVLTGAGSITPTSSISDATGGAFTNWVLGPMAGPQTARASVGDILVVTYAATAQSVAPPVVPVVSVTVLPAAVTLASGASQLFSAAPKDVAGTDLTGRTVAWTTDNAAVASVAATGLVLGTLVGAATITATVEGVVGTATVTVAPGVVSLAASTIATAATVIAPGAAVQVTLRAKDAAGNNIASGGLTVTFANAGGTSTGTFSGTTDNGDGTYIATFTGVYAGTPTTIGATIDGQPVTSSSPTVEVGAGLTVATVTVSPTPVTLASGTTQQFVATPRDIAGNGVPGRPVIWSTNAATIASVDAVGLVQAALAGTATITATVDGYAGTASVTVTPGDVSPSISVITSSAAVVVSGSTVDVTLQAKDAAGNTITTGGLVVVFTHAGGTSTGTFSATTDNANGTYAATFTGVDAGTPTTIGATVGGQVVASSLPTIQVTPAPVVPVASVSVRPAEVTVVVGSTRQLVATAMDANGVELENRSVVWSTDAPTIARVDSSGLVEGLLPGSANVFATVEGLQGRSEVFVVAGPVSIATSLISVAAAVVAPGDAVLVTLQAKDAAGNNIGSGGLAVEFDHTFGTSTGTISATTDLGNGRYTATFTGVGVGTPTTITATIDGQAVTSSLPTIQVVAQTVAVVPVELAAGVGFSCRLRTTSAKCWGANAIGQIGDGTTNMRPLLTDVSGGQEFEAITVGATHACALTREGQPRCWGENTHGEFGNGTTSNSSVPVPAAQGRVFVQITAGYYYTCGLTPTGDAYCWGNNGRGNIGDGTSTTRLIPTLVVGNLKFTTISAGGDNHTCALTATGAAYCWGYNDDGELGDGTFTTRLTPTAVAGSLAFRAISAANFHTCALTTANEAYCWGDNNVRQLGDGSASDQSSPRAVQGGRTFTQISAGGDRACAITSSRTLFCWGFNPDGRLGDGTTTTAIAPVAIADDMSFNLVAVGDNHTCGRLTDGSFWCWGVGGFGQIGNGTIANRFLPVPTGLVAASPATSRVTIDDDELDVGQITSIALQAKDADGYGIVVGGHTVAFGQSGGTSAGTIGTVVDEGNGTYRASFTATTVGTPTTIGATVAGETVTTELPTITVADPVVVRTWTGAVSTDWSDPANWQPAGVPRATDFVVVQAAVNQPVLTAPSVAGSLRVGGAVGVRLTMAGQSLTVGGDLIIHSLGVLVMTNPADLLIALGRTIFQGGDQTGLLTAGEVRLSGAFHQIQQIGALGFVASGTHRVVLVGADGQTISFMNPGQSYFQNLDISRATRVGFQFANIIVKGALISRPGSAPAPVLAGQGNTLTASKFQVDKLVVEYARVILAESEETGQQFDNVTFVDEPNFRPMTSLTQLTVNAQGSRPARELTFANLRFIPLTAGNTGHYLNLSSVTDNLVLNLPGANATIGGNGPTFTQQTGEAVANWSGPPNAIAATSATSQSGQINSLVSVRPAVVVTDATALPLAGVTVTFAVASGGGTVTGGSATTNASGVATVGSWKLGPALGNSNALTATIEGSGISGNPVTFTATGELTFASVAARQSHSCAVGVSGAAYCWGHNYGGKLGNGNLDDSDVPVLVSGDLTFASVTVGPDHSCGLTTTGAAYCWGGDGNGAIGTGPLIDYVTTPAAVLGGHTFRSLSAGHHYTCGVTTANAAYCWGYNGYGNIGNGTFTQADVPVPVSGGLAFATVVAGSSNTCGVTTTGAGYCWGSNAVGELGTGSLTPDYSNVPAAITGGLSLTAIGVGNQANCGLASGGAASCWGWNDNGQLGSVLAGGVTFTSTPVVVSGGRTFASVHGGHLYYTCGITPTGAAYCWGNNNDGQLGDGSNTRTSTPTAVIGGLTFSTMDAGDGFACGVTTAGEIYCWGANESGQLGNGTRTPTSSPMKISMP
jgi:alpha-tubulin suppressor-like RCC1 family protein